jgi:hypothetical protein
MAAEIYRPPEKESQDTKDHKMGVFTHYSIYDVYPAREKVGIISNDSSGAFSTGQGRCCEAKNHYTPENHGKPL